MLIEDLEAHGCKLVALDVTDEASAQAAVDTVTAEAGAVGVMIDNAGINELVSPIEPGASARPGDEVMLAL